MKNKKLEARRLLEENKSVSEIAKTFNVHKATIYHLQDLIRNSSMYSKILSLFSTQAGKEKIQNGCLSQTELFIYFYLIMLFDYFGLTQQTLDLIARDPFI
nr:helix-turn-helix domain-containing protein [Legionella pneumophila]